MLISSILCSRQVFIIYIGRLVCMHNNPQFSTVLKPVEAGSQEETATDEVDTCDEIQAMTLSPQDSLNIELMKKLIQAVQSLQSKKSPESPSPICLWHLLGQVLDRIFFIFFLVVNIICFLLLFPNLF